MQGYGVIVYPRRSFEPILQPFLVVAILGIDLVFIG